ncbi:2'-5' RNA ligase family protein [Dermatophilaceae bacterium Soc4.6]
MVVAPLTPLEVGDRFATRDWPLHVTVVPTFFSRASVTQVATALAASCGSLPAVTAVVGADALFGPRQTVPVSEVVMDPALRAAHAVLVEGLGDIEPESPGFWGEGFRAHITHRRDHRLHPGDIVRLTQVTLVDMEPGQPLGMRAVLAVSPLLTPGPAVGAESSPRAQGFT